MTDEVVALFGRGDGVGSIYYLSQAGGKVKSRTRWFESSLRLQASSHLTVDCAETGESCDLDSVVSSCTFLLCFCVCDLGVVVQQATSEWHDSGQFRLQRQCKVMAPPTHQSDTRRRSWYTSLIPCCTAQNQERRSDCGSPHETRFDWPQSLLSASVLDTKDPMHMTL